MVNYLVIYDVRRIQEYIFQSNKIKEITAASDMVRTYLDSKLAVVAKKYGISVDTNWKNHIKDVNDNINSYLNSFKDNHIEYVALGAGNLFIFYHGDNQLFIEYNNALQEAFLFETGSLQLAYAKATIDENTKSFFNLRNEAKKELDEVKKRMARLVINNYLPISKLDPIYSTPIIGTYDNRDITLLSKLKLEHYKNMEQISSIKFIDDLVKDDNGNEPDKRMIAVVHIDGNDMGAMISNYLNAFKNIKLSFSQELAISRDISKKIDDVFVNKVKDILKNYENNCRLILNSGDDITFICDSRLSLTITKKIMDMLSLESLYPSKDISNENFDFLKKDNRFSCCAGICYTHIHYPFHRAYEMAEEVCSIAKSKAKFYRVNTQIEGFNRPTSWLDYEICDTGVTKNLINRRKDFNHLYLKPYLVVDDNVNVPDEVKLSSLLDYLNKFKNDNSPKISRGVLKEIRNTYEKDPIYSKILFVRLKSRNQLNVLGKDEEIYNPFINDKAKYYDATSLLDLINGIDYKKESVE